MIFKKLFLAAGMTILALGAQAQMVFDANLYNGKPPHSNGDKQDTAKVRVFLPSDKEATGRAVVIFPGGGYSSLSMEKEGYDWAEYFQNQGIAAIVLKYRLPNGRPEVPVEDAEQALRLVRLNATSWKLNRNDVGVMGFSAGGHLAAMVATSSTGDAKPDFQILFYPVISMTEGVAHEGSMTALLGKHASKKEQKSIVPTSMSRVSRPAPSSSFATTTTRCRPSMASTTMSRCTRTTSPPRSMSIPAVVMAGVARSASVSTKR